MLQFYIYAVLAFLVYWQFIYPYVVYRLQTRKHKCGQIPVAPNVPFGIITTISLFKDLQKGVMLQKLAKTELRNSFKTYLFQGLFGWFITTRDPENIKAILATKVDDFGVRDRIEVMSLTSGSGIFNQDGEGWKHSRAVLRPQFSKEQISRLTDINKHTGVLIGEIKKRNCQIEIQEYFHMLTMDTASEFLMGESVESLKFSESSNGFKITDEDTGESMYSGEFVKAYQWLNRFTLQRMLLKRLAFIAVWLKPEYRKYVKQKQFFIDHYVKKALRSTKEELENDTKYVLSRELVKSNRNPIYIRDQVFSMLIAGRDTTASTLSYSFYYFAKYPELWEKVKQDVWEVFPDGPDSEITYDDLRKLKYLQMFVKEVLRLSPVVPLNTRRAMRDTTLPRGGGPSRSEPVFVPKGTQIVYSVYVLHRDPDIYGPDADKFRPERWAPEKKLPNSPMYSWGYIPFNGGPRICLGQQFALTEVYVVICNFALNFDKIYPGEGFSHNLTDRNSITSKVGGAGVPLKLVPFVLN